MAKSATEEQAANLVTVAGGAMDAALIAYSVDAITSPMRMPDEVAGGLNWAVLCFERWNAVGPHGKPFCHFSFRNSYPGSLPARPCAQSPLLRHPPMVIRKEPLLKFQMSYHRKSLQSPLFQVPAVYVRLCMDHSGSSPLL